MKASASITAQYDSPFSPFCASQFCEALSWASDCGFDGVEIIICDPLLLDADLIISKINTSGLEVSTLATGQASMEGLSMSSPSREVREATRRRLFLDIDFSVALGKPNVTIGSLRGKNISISEDIESKLFLNELLFVMEYAEKRDVKINLEGINRYELRLMNSTSSVFNFIREIGYPKCIGILYDTFHSSIEDPSMVEAIRQYGNAFSHVHIADSNRCLPGEGHINFSAIVEELKKVGYDGYLSLEVSNLPSAEHIITSTNNCMAVIKNYLAY